MADAPEETGDAQLSFKVKTSGDGSHNITMSESATVLDLKNKLAAEEFEDIPADRQRLIYSGRVMKNDDALSVYKIKTGNTIHLVKSAASNPSRPAQTSAAA
ncbi:deubiquitination-protection protein dph1, partial [Magnaporthiopsis poae ATCC 64411]